MRWPSRPARTPRHSRRRGTSAGAVRRTRCAAWPDTLVLDIPHAGGVDTTHISLGLLREAERLAAAAYGGDDARFLVNGSTTGNLAMLLATCADGDTVIVSRMLHKSGQSARIASGAPRPRLCPGVENGTAFAPPGRQCLQERRFD